MTDITAAWRSHRPYLVNLAYQMLGDIGGAEDIAQEAFLRLSRTDEVIDDVRGWLTVVAGRLCLDQLRSARARLETILPPEHDPQSRSAGTQDPADRVTLDDEVSSALLEVLGRLSPGERVAFVLHDVFAVPFDGIAEILDRTPDATRQLASRARRRVQGSAPSVQLDLVRQRDVVDAFLRAARGGDFDALMQLLHPEVMLVPDAAAVNMGSLREMRGAGEVASALSGGARGATLAIIEGVAGFVWAPGGQIQGVVTFTLRDDRIVEINVTGDAARIADLDIATLED